MSGFDNIPDDDTLLQKIGEAGAIHQGHFVGKSGRHLDRYCDKDDVWMDPVLAYEISGYLAEIIADNGIADEAEFIVSPAMGAIQLGQYVSLHLNRLLGRTQQNRLCFVYAEKRVRELPGGKKEESFVFSEKRSFERRIRGKKVVCVEDLGTTGLSLGMVIDLLRKPAIDATILGAAFFWNRGAVAAERLKVPHVVSLITKELPSWTHTECPMCRDGVPVRTDLGHGKQFLEEQGRAA